ncbi:MAG: hypothetical protein Kapaf2KO_04110 [Candidatus Kapaibacteriales bacterium]
MKNFKYILLALAIPFFAYSDGNDKELKSSDLNFLKPRLIGPAVTSGRVIDIAVDPSNKSKWIVGVASGGVWLSENAGHTFKPVFDNQTTYSIGCVTIDKNNPNIVWVGSGENNSQRSVGYGDGIYKSVDGGYSWKNMGLENSEHIGKIIVDPRNSDRVLVAAQGPLWNAGGDRGLYITEDGGKTWTKSLEISENTGVSDIAIDRRNPDIIYATSYQRRRRQWTLINGGPEGGIHKSTDGGKTWSKLTSGLPGGDIGRIGLAIAHNNPDVVYAIIETVDGGGFYKTENQGANWKKVSGKVSGSPQYYQEIFTDPNNDNRIYCMDTYSAVSEDGGKNWDRINSSHKHVDDHALWIDPDNSSHLIIGNDGGVYESFDMGNNWRHFENIPTVQFYKIGLDNDLPFYNVYGGTQDNNTLGGPSQTKNAHGILNQHWNYIRSGDGFKPVVDPTDPNTIYAQAQYASIGRVNRENKESMGITPQAQLGEELKWNWSSPIIISPHNNSTLYYAANKVFKSTDKGNTWTSISGDLTKQIDRNSLKVMGKIWPPETVAKNASTSLYGSIVSLDESPKKAGLLYAGTDDGLIQVSENDGASWTKVSSFGSVPEGSYVSDIQPSLFDENTVFASFDNHKSGDFKPYLLKSIDKGKTWKSISSDLPEKGTVYSVEQDHIDKDILFAGTEFGAFVTLDGGDKWHKIPNLPTIAVYDIELHQRENDVVLGTFGRGIYIVDDYSPLRTIEQVKSSGSNSIMVSDAQFFMPGESQGQGWSGATFFKADNPEFGLNATYFVTDMPKSLKSLRSEKDKKAEEAKKDIEYPTWEQLRAEDLEIDPYLLFTVLDASGNTVRRLKKPARDGFATLNWDLRYSDVSRLSENTDINRQSSMPVLPGNYKLTMSLVTSDGISQLAESALFAVEPLENNIFNSSDLASSISFRNDLAETYKDFQGASGYLRELDKNLDILKNSILLGANSNLEDIKTINSAKLKLEDIDLILNGNSSISKRNGAQPESVGGRLGGMLYAYWYTSEDPANNHINSLQIAKNEFLRAYDMMKEVDKLYRDLAQKSAATGGAWLPGTLPSINQD